MPFINFIIVNAKNLTDGILKKTTEIWHILSLVGTQRIVEEAS